MSYLEKLLDGAEVEWMALGELTLTTDNVKWKNNTNSYRYVDLTSIERGTNTIIQTSEINRSNAPSRAQKIVTKNDVIFATTRPTQQRLFLIDDEYSGQVASTGYCVLRAKPETVLPEWVFYHLASADFNEYLEKNQSGIAYPAISDAKVKEYVIPIPCPNNPQKSLQIQKEIVRILDTFTELTSELTAELKAELTARKKQYNYYREQLLNFKEEKVERKTLDDISEFRRGSFPQPYGNTEWYDGEGAMPFVQVVDVGTDMQLVQNTKNKISRLAQPKSVFVPRETVIVTLQGSIGRVAITQYDAYVDRTLAIFENFKIDINKKYFAYQLEEKFRIEKEYARGSTIKTITKGEFKEFVIPIPSLEEQTRIVSILDQFDSLTNSISKGLSKEIALRKKQYEHYRDVLLTFPKTDVMA